MRVTETVPIQNDKKERSIELTLDTDTGRLQIKSPVLWSKDPEVDLTTLQARVANLSDATVRTRHE